MLNIRRTAVAGVTLRPIQATDIAFLERLYASTRAPEMALLPDWSEAMKEDFLRGQFTAQHSHYRKHYPDARYDVIVRDGEDIGRLYVCALSDEIRLMDISLLPEHRNKGIGGALVRELQQQAETERKFVGLHVEEENPARRLYLRLGFEDAGDISFYKLMHWVPAGVSPSSSGPG